MSLTPEREAGIRPGERVGRYKLLQQIGEGGCGVVYLAEQEEPVRRRVALKIIKLGMDTKAVVARFEAERQALAMMDHPNIAKVLDAGATDTGRPYFVMELVRGVRLTAYCDENKLSTEERLKLFLQVCRAVQHAHQKGVIHRDLKPSNILVTINDGVATPKVIDFGIAKSTQGRLTDHTLFTAFEQFLGTPAYMSPEQAVMTSLDVDTRTDIYSLGVLLYELLTGRTPFDQKQLLASGVEEMRRTIREQEPPRPSTCLSTMAAEALTTTANHHGTDVPKLIHLVRGDLDWIVMKALEKDRTRRYETANALVMDIQRYLSNEPVAARPPGRWYRFQKMVRRNKLTFAATGAVVLALAVGVAVSTWRLIRERRAVEAAVAAERDAEQALTDESKLRQQADTAKAIAAIELALARNRPEEAETILKQIPVPVLRAHGGSRFLAAIYGLGNWYAVRGRWQGALAWFRMLDEIVPNDDYNRVWYHFRTACLLAQIGDLEAYRQYCQHTVAQFGETKQPLNADLVAKAGLILPASGVDLEVVAKLNDLAVASTNQSSTMPWFELDKALADYRRGRFAGAVEWSQKHLPLREDWPTRKAQAYLVLAMAQHQLQRSREARSALAAGATIVETEMGKLENGNLGVEFWQDWIIAHALLREAKALIEGPRASPGTEKPKP